MFKNTDSARTNPDAANVLCHILAKQQLRFCNTSWRQTPNTNGDLTVRWREGNENAFKKSEATSFHSLSPLFQPIYFIEKRQTPLELNSWDPYPNSEREYLNFVVTCLRPP